MSNEPTTQQKHPIRAVLRTTAAAIVGFLPILPVIANEFGLVESLPWVASVLAVSAAITRILATEQVENWLNKYAPWLTATETPGKHRKDDNV